MPETHYRRSLQHPFENCRLKLLSLHRRTLSLLSTFRTPLMNTPSTCVAQIDGSEFLLDAALRNNCISARVSRCQAVGVRFRPNLEWHCLVLGGLRSLFQA